MSKQDVPCSEYPEDLQRDLRRGAYRIRVSSGRWCRARNRKRAEGQDDRIFCRASA